MNEWKMITYQGWENCYLYNGNSIKMIVTADIGPRIIHFGSAKGNNQFYEDAHDLGTTGGQTSRLYGGHRFWTAPEDKVRTYIPDNFLVEVETEGSALTVTAPIEACGIQKTILIEPSRTPNMVKITHLMINNGQTPLELAPWGLSMMHPGGTAIIPLPPKASHSNLLTPTHSFALWGYTDLTDSRWGWGERYLFLRQDEYIHEPQKIGIHNPQGWGAYLNDGTLFIKFSAYSPKSNYPDFGSNFEFFTNNNFLEIETLGALSSIQPGQQVRHIEHWALFEGIKTVVSESGVEQNILPLVEKTRNELLPDLL
jgi:hypothetical protein